MEHADCCKVHPEGAVSYAPADVCAEVPESELGGWKG